jgi:glucokinase
VGGGLFLDGRIYRGAVGMAGEIGHVTVVPEGFPCNCGNRGCLEQYASANGLRNLVARDGLFGGLTDAALGDPDLPRRLYEAAMAGDERCRGYFDSFGYHLAIGIGTILQLLNVPLVILAGGLARSFPAFGPRLMAELPGRGYRCVNEIARVVPCALWEDGGILGAAALVDEALDAGPP